MKACETSTGRSNKSNDFLLDHYITLNLPTLDQVVSDLQQLGVARFQMVLESCFCMVPVLFTLSYCTNLTWKEKKNRTSCLGNSAMDDISK